MADDALTRFWPLFGLELRTPRLSLSPVRDADLAEIIDLALAGVHDSDTMPFTIPWTLAPADELPANLLRYQWGLRSRTGPDDWVLPFAVRVDGRLVGLQDLGARDFAVLRAVETGSWLGRSYQGQGIGTEMRAAVLLLAFDYLGAETAHSGAFLDNPRSRGVSDRLGYRPNGVEIIQRRPGERAVSQRLMVTPDDFRRPEWVLRVEGLAACLALLGLSSTAVNTP